MSIPSEGRTHPLEFEVRRLFCMVSEALAGATDALLGGEAAEGIRVVADDESFDNLSNQLTDRIWKGLNGPLPASEELRHVIGLLLIVPELERSADLAEHIAQRAVAQLGPEMSPLSRGIVQRMSEVALEMWAEAAESYIEGTAVGALLDEADDELDILNERLTTEVATSAMPLSVAAQVTLLGRFYERLGDHAVNLARRIEFLHRA